MLQPYVNVRTVQPVVQLTMYILGVLTPSMRGIPALHSTQQACWISSLATSSCFSSYAAWMFSKVGEGNIAEPGPGPSTNDALAPISSPGPNGTGDRHRGKIVVKWEFKSVFVRKNGIKQRLLAACCRLNTSYYCSPVSSIYPELGHPIKECSHGMNSTAEWISAHFEQVIPSGGRWNKHLTPKALILVFKGKYINNHHTIDLKSSCLWHRNKISKTNTARQNQRSQFTRIKSKIKSSQINIFL